MNNSPNPTMKHPIWLPLVVAVILGGAFIIGKNVESTQLPPVTISVSGEGKVSAVPDIASLSFGVHTGRQTTAQAAMEKLSNDMNAVMEAVKAKGIEEKDIRTESLNLFPAYDWDEGTRVDRGFEASQSLRVKVRDLAKIGDVLTAATSAGANQAGGVNFTIDEPDDLQKEARDEAIEDAKEKAKELANELGVSLGKLRGFNEGGYSPAPMYERAMMMDMGMGGGGGGGGMPVPSGEQEVRMNVTLTYEVR
jgi:uncharacterized protein